MNLASFGKMSASYIQKLSEHYFKNKIVLYDHGECITIDAWQNTIVEVLQPTGSKRAESCTTLRNKDPETWNKNIFSNHITSSFLEEWKLHFLRKDGVIWLWKWFFRCVAQNASWFPPVHWDQLVATKITSPCKDARIQTYKNCSLWLFRCIQNISCGTVINGFPIYFQCTGVSQQIYCLI